MWHDIGLWPGVSFRNWVARITLTVFVLTTALVSVGLTAPADGLFSIAVHPVFLGLAVDVKVGALQRHFAWSVLPLFIN